MIVRREGEQTVVGLIRTWEQRSDLSYVDGITWRSGDAIIANRSRAPIRNLDEYRPGWELVDWPRYSMFGFKTAAGLQYSRGCTLTCSSCGQLYKQAGVDYLVMGIESLKDSVVTDIRKNIPLAISKEAVRLLRGNNIISLTNIIYGLEEESWETIFEKFRGLFELDSDILNAIYLTPHFWTAQGKSTQPYNVIQTDLDKWS